MCIFCKIPTGSFFYYFFFVLFKTITFSIFKSFHVSRWLYDKHFFLFILQQLMKCLRYTPFTLYCMHVLLTSKNIFIKVYVSCTYKNVHHTYGTLIYIPIYKCLKLTVFMFTRDTIKRQFDLVWHDGLNVQLANYIQKCFFPLITENHRKSFISFFLWKIEIKMLYNLRQGRRRRRYKLLIKYHFIPCLLMIRFQSVCVCVWTHAFILKMGCSKCLWLMFE